MIRRPPRSTHCISSAASDVYKRQVSTQSTWGKYIQGEAYAGGSGCKSKRWGWQNNVGNKSIWLFCQSRPENDLVRSRSSAILAPLDGFSRSGFTGNYRILCWKPDKPEFAEGG
eukprot:TRINITY_DN5889_c0_g1_i4.p5 TRINITY_DN5889_c0_g1~~TRINITY_DN5889_c0_g1_i4.p5  ORF type:complete len:114 (+),score=22.44 TRINITY_DN5889_c0_g1_i4:92-433(+)